MENEFIVCQSCGEKNELSSGFCKKCTKPLANNAQSPQGQPQHFPQYQAQPVPKKKKGKGCLIAVAVCFILLMVIVIGTALGGNSNENKPTETKGNTVATTQTTKEPLVITVDTLVAELRENALKASTTYKDQYVEVTGKLVSIDSSGKYFSLGILTDDFSLDTVMCYIKSEHLETVMEFQTGQKVTVIGTITSVGELMGYSIKIETIK